jgi:hypothetical protein
MIGGIIIDMDQEPTMEKSSETQRKCWRILLSLPLFSPFRWLDTLILTANCSVYLIWERLFLLLVLCLKWGSQRVWPVDKGCLISLGT